jgi:hypothetical protein
MGKQETQNLTHREKGIQEFLGGIVDNLFLLVPKIVRHLKPPRNISRSEYESHIDFYIQKGFTENPENFFTFPNEIPTYKILLRRPYLDGEYQLISFSSGYEPQNPMLRESYHAHRNNSTCYIVRWTHGRDDVKTVLCLHGYMLGNPRQAERMFRIRKMFELGLDVALFITPFHWKRAPVSKTQRGIYLQPDNVVMTCECVGQTMYDLYSTCKVLRILGAGSIGLLGASLGGYLAALFICLQPIVDFAAMMVPVVNLSGTLGPDTAKLPFPINAEFLKKTQKVYEFHSPLNFHPKIPKDRILIIASQGDRLCPFEFVRLLCKKWDWPEHQFLRGGHWLIFNNNLRGQTWYSFLQRMGYLISKKTKAHNT